MPRHRLRMIGLLELGDRAGVELELRRRDRVGEVMRLRGADDRRGDERLRQHPGERDDRRLGIQLLGRLDDPFADRLILARPQAKRDAERVGAPAHRGCALGPTPEPAR